VFILNVHWCTSFHLFVAFRIFNAVFTERGIYGAGVSQEKYVWLLRRYPRIYFWRSV